MSYQGRLSQDDNRQLTKQHWLLQPYIHQGNTCMKNKLFEDALTFFTRALAVDESNSAVNGDLLFKRAQCYRQLGNRQMCLESCDSALQLVPGFVEAQKLKNECQAEVEISIQIRNGEEFRNKADWPNAIASYTKAIELDPKMASNYSNRAESYLFMEDFEATMFDAKKSTELDPTNFEGYICEAKCYISMDDMGSGMDVLKILENAGMMERLQLEQLLEISKLRKIQSLLDEASTSFEQKDYAKCQQQIDMAFGNIPHSIPYKVMKTDCLIRLYNFEAALRNIQQFVLRNSRRLVFLKGLFYYYNDNFETAKQYLEPYSRENPEDEDAVQLLASSNRMLQIMTPSLLEKIPLIFDSNKITLRKFNTEIENTFKSSDVLNSSEIRMRLYYQRALIQQKLNQKKESLRDCTLALNENPSYHNARKLQSELDGIINNTQSAQPSGSFPITQHQISDNKAPVMYVGGDFIYSPHTENRNRTVNKNDSDNTFTHEFNPTVSLTAL